jgi:O-antigen ligase
MGLALIVSLVRLVGSDERRTTYYWITSLIIYAGLLATFSRTGILAFCLVMLVSFRFFYRRTRLDAYKAVLLMLFVIIPIIPFLLQDTLSSKFLDVNPKEIRDFMVIKTEPGADDPNFAIAQRLIIYKKAWGIARRHPLWGFGFGRLNHAHDLFLQLWLDIGALGLICFLLLFFVQTAACIKMLSPPGTRSEPLIVISFLASIFLLAKGLGDLIWLRPLWGLLAGLVFAFEGERQPEP